MKKQLAAVCIGLISLAAHGFEKEVVKSTLTDVTVYAKGAQLFQKANYTVKPGLSEVVIQGISPFIDVKSIQVKAFGNVVLLDTKHSIYYPKPADFDATKVPVKIKKDIQLLQDSIANMQFDIEEIQGEIEVLAATKNIIVNNGAIRGTGKVNDSINLLKQAVDYYSVKITEINKKMHALSRKLKEKQAQQREMDNRLTKLKKHQMSTGNSEKENEPIHQITVTLSAKELSSGKITISYLVANAGWKPQYDLRSDGFNSKLNLTYKAKIFQNSGLNWDNVKLTISTNNPYHNKTKPTIHPWYIDYRANIQATRMDNHKGKQMVRDEEMPAMMYSNSFKKEVADEVFVAGQTSDQFVEVIRQFTSTEFKIDLPYSILSNNEQHMVLIKIVDLEVEYSYYAAPKLDNGVFLVAQLTKLDELGLVPAQANIYFDGSYVGETYIDPTSSENKLSLSLGKDPNIQIKRLLVKKDSKERIVGDKKEKEMAYTIEVSNKKATPIEIMVHDQMPITTNSEILIESTELSKGERDATTGTIEWKFTLKPKESKTINFSYKVTHKKELNLPFY
jgi:uncharacterized protein (TIGR02231 family)